MNKNIRLSGELLDIVDPQTGEPTGERKDKTLIHYESLWHPDVHVWLTNGTHVLEQKRLWNKKLMPNQWDISVGEHVGAGESYLDAAVRGAREELGLQVAPERLAQAGIFAVEMAVRDGGWTHRVVGENFVLVERDLTPDNINERLTLQASEVAGARLYPIDQLEADIAHPQTAELHAEHPRGLWELGIAAMRAAMS